MRDGLVKGRSGCRIHRINKNIEEKKTRCRTAYGGRQVVTACGHLGKYLAMKYGHRSFNEAVHAQHAHRRAPHGRNAKGSLSKQAVVLSLLHADVLPSLIASVTCSHAGRAGDSRTHGIRHAACRVILSFYDRAHLQAYARTVNFSCLTGRYSV